MWGKPHKHSTKDSEHMKVSLELIVKITLPEHFNLPNHSSISYTVKVVGQEEDKNRRLRLEESWIHPT